MPFWQPANILHSVLIFMLLWQINIVVVLLTYLLRRRRSTRFSKSVMVSVADNKPRLRWTWGQNQRPLQKRVADTGSDIRSIAGNVFVFQQDNAPASRARQTVELLRARPQSLSVLTCGQPTALIWTRWTAASAWVVMQEQVYTRLQSGTWSSCDRGWLRHGVSYSRAWRMTPLTGGEQGSKLVSK